jgi:hypothetical protein
MKEVTKEKEEEGEEGTINHSLYCDFVLQSDLET